MHIAKEINEKIRKRAYQLWEKAGRPECDEKEFWLRAELELCTELSSKLAYLLGDDDHITIELDVLFPDEHKISHDELKTSNQEQIEQAKKRLIS